MRIKAKPPKEERIVSLASLEAVQKWASRELEFWRPLGGALASGPYPLDWQGVERRLQHLAGDTADQNYGGEQPQSVLENVLNVLQITSRDRRAQFLRHIAAGAEDATTALTHAALTEPSRVVELRRHGHWHTYAAEALAYRALFNAAVGGEVLEEFRGSLAALVHDATLALGDTQTELGRATQAREDFERESQNGLAKAAGELEALLEAFKRHQDELENKLTTQLALRAPVDYWRSKASQHRSSASSYRWWFTALATGGLVAVGLLAIFWLVPTMAARDTAWWALVLFSALLALWAWPLRLTSKLYLAHTHLAEDASEREVITKTFLALGEVVALSDEDRQLLLAALIRPTTAGLVKDDGGLSLTDLVAARLVGKES